jgi:hypothetical protein
MHGTARLWTFLWPAAIASSVVAAACGYKPWADSTPPPWACATKDPYTGGCNGIFDPPSGPRATPLNLASTTAAALALAPLAKVDAPGMTAEGSPMAGTFAEGQVLEQRIPIEPNKCYTFLAAGDGPQELEITLLGLVAGYPVEPLTGWQRATGSKVTLGAKNGCIFLLKNWGGVPAKWVIRVTKGAGVVAGQAYSKDLALVR